MKSLVVVYSYHHNNTLKVDQAIAKVLDAQVKSPQQTVPDELGQYDLVGFGSGIDSDKHYKEILDFADKLPRVINKKAFVFSTSGIPIGISFNNDWKSIQANVMRPLRIFYDQKATRLLMSLVVQVLTLINFFGDSVG